MPKQLYDLRTWLKRHVERGINVGYLKTVLFPEQFTYEIPIPLSSVSYCKFTDKQEIIINTGPLGQGMLVWHPRVNFGPQLFIFYPDSTQPSAESKYRYLKGFPYQIGIDPTATYAPFQDTARTYWKAGLPAFQNSNFTQCALVGGSLSLQYVGKVEQEAGIWVGGHIYGVPMKNLVLDDIENAQWATRSRPGEGQRYLFLPKDQTDYEFYPCIQGKAFNQGATPASTDDKFQVNQTTSSALDDSIFTFPDGMGPTADFVNNSNYVAIYWTGMEQGKNWIRLDAIRKFCGIPNQKTRDIVELQRPSKNYDVNKTFAVLNMIGSVSPLGGHTLKEVDRVMDTFIEVLPNAGFILDNGGLTPATSLEGLVQQLGNSSDSKQLEGQMGGQRKLMYTSYL